MSDVLMSLWHLASTVAASLSLPPPLNASVPGAAGGLAWFLVGVHRQTIRRSKLWRKASIETLGGTLVATFVGPAVGEIVGGEHRLALACFAVGTAWSGVLQRLRGSITEVVRERLNGSGHRAGREGEGEDDPTPKPVTAGTKTEPRPVSPSVRGEGDPEEVAPRVNATGAKKPPPRPPRGSRIAGGSRPGTSRRAKGGE